MRLQVSLVALIVPLLLMQAYCNEPPDHGDPGGFGSGPPVQRNDPGAEAPPYKIVFVCDGSASTQDTIAILRDELEQTIKGLKPTQSFDIIFHGGEKVLSFKPDLVAATPTAKRKAENWLEYLVTAGKPDPSGALEMALKLKPDLIEFIAGPDDFSDTKGLLNLARRLNADRHIHITTMLLVTEGPEKGHFGDLAAALKEIASKNGGAFRWFNVDETKPPLISHIGPQTAPATMPSSSKRRWENLAIKGVLTQFLIPARKIL